MWVVLNYKQYSYLRCRITPTYVGSTIMVVVGKLGIRDHPHVCG